MSGPAPGDGGSGGEVDPEIPGDVVDADGNFMDVLAVPEVIDLAAGGRLASAPHTGSLPPSILALCTAFQGCSTVCAGVKFGSLERNP
jgi:hypothetical protein